MRLACLLAVAALLLAACSGGDGDRLDELEERVAQLETTPSGHAPVWTVLSTQMTLRGERELALAIDYIAPDGSTVTWERVIWEAGLPWFECWQSAVVGKALPACARSS